MTQWAWVILDKGRRAKGFNPLGRFLVFSSKRRLETDRREDFLRYVLTYASHFINVEAANSKYVLTLIVNEVLSLLMNHFV